MSSEVETVTFEDVQKVKDNPDVLLIDVRRTEELQETGNIPGSINIPLGELENGLKLPESEFQEKYGRDKPEKNFPIIFSCLGGKRAANALEIAKGLGYTSGKYYPGSWKEWAQKNGLAC